MEEDIKLGKSIIFFQTEKNQLRRCFDEYFPKYQMRIRNTEKSGLIDDITYFNGILPFYVKQQSKNSNNIKISLPINLYKANATQYKMALNDKNYTLKQYKDDLISVIAKLKIYFNYILKLDSITFNVNYSTRDDNLVVDKDAANKQVNSQFESYKKSLSNLVPNIENIKFVNEAGKCKIDLSCINQDDPEVMIKLEFTFFDLFQFQTRYDGEDYKNNTQLVSGYEFKINTCASDTTYELNDENMNKLKEILVEANRVYKGNPKLEKRYQHMLIKYGHKSESIFNNKDEIVIPFEQEYEIRKYSEGTKKETGRVDCVYYSVDKNNINKLKNIYLVEVKIDDDVVAGGNGVLSHLADIEYIFRTDKEKCEYFNNLISYINNRRTSLGEDELDYTDYKVNFYTVFGYADPISRYNIKEKLFILNDSNLISKYYQNEDVKRDDKKTEYMAYVNSVRDVYEEHNILSRGDVIPSLDLDKHLKEHYKMEELSILSFKERLSDKINIKFFFDLNKFDMNTDMLQSGLDENGNYIHEWDKFIFGDTQGEYLNNINFAEWDPNIDIKEFLDEIWDTRL